jgi:hypothetical protein
MRQKRTFWADVGVAGDRHPRELDIEEGDKVVIAYRGVQHMYVVEQVADDGYGNKQITFRRSGAEGSE